MRIGDIDFGRVAVLVLDYDPYRDDKPSKSVVEIHDMSKQLLRAKYEKPSGKGLDVTAFAPEELVAIHQKDLEDNGVRFFPNWQESREYRDLLREGLRQGTDLLLMKDIGNKGGYGIWFMPQYTLYRANVDELEIINPSGKIDIRPKISDYFQAKKRWSSEPSPRLE